MSADDHRPEELFDDLLAGIKGTIEAEIGDELAIIEPDFPAIIDELRRRRDDGSDKGGDDNDGDRDDGDDDRLFATDDSPALSPAWGAASPSGCSRGRAAMGDRYDADDDLLSGLVRDARQEIEADLAARRLLPVPPLPQPAGDLPGAVTAARSPTPAGLATALSPSAAELATAPSPTLAGLATAPSPTPADLATAAPTSTPAGLRWLGAALTIAAAVALLWGLGPSLARPLLGGAPTPSQAQWSERDDAVPGQASTRAPEPDRPRQTARRRGALPDSAAEPTAAGSDEPLGDDGVAETIADANTIAASIEAATEPATGDTTDRPTDKTSDTSADTASDTTSDTTSDTSETTASKPRGAETSGRGSRDLDALEAEAEALWRAGDRAGAEALLRTIIRLSRARRRADLAYGDLFTITRQLYGREREAAVWREYLARFPRGRYADDARAGLCRRESTGEAGPCWSRYLLDFPSGTHRDEAGRASDGD